MRKLHLVLLALTLSIAMLAATVAPAMAAKPTTNPSNGSVKVDLLTWYDNGTFWGGADLPKVGEVILNTTGSDRLQMLFKIDSVPNLVNYDVWVGVLDLIDGVESGFWDADVFLDVLNTNDKGKGNTMVKMDIPEEFIGDTILVIFSVGEDYSVDADHPIYANNALLPLK